VVTLIYHLFLFHPWLSLATMKFIADLRGLNADSSGKNPNSFCVILRPVCVGLRLPIDRKKVAYATKRNNAKVVHLADSLHYGRDSQITIECILHEPKINANLTFGRR